MSSVDLMSLLAFVSSILLCNSVRERMQQAHWIIYLSQSSRILQRAFCGRLKLLGDLSLTDFHRGTEAYLLTGELTNVCKQRTDITERYRQF